MVLHIAFRHYRVFLGCLLTTLSAGMFLGSVGGCGGGGGGNGATQIIAITISPDSAQLIPAQSATFSVTVSGTDNQQVAWSVREGLAGGTIGNDGVYRAPSLAGTFHVVATSQADRTKNAVVPVTVRITVTATPASASLTLRETRQLSAIVSGSQNQIVTWNVQEGESGGSVSSTGLYSAPATPGTYHIIATSQADTQQSAVVTVTVLAGGAAGTVE